MTHSGVFSVPFTPMCCPQFCDHALLAITELKAAGAPTRSAPRPVLFRQRQTAMRAEFSADLAQDGAVF